MPNANPSKIQFFLFLIVLFLNSPFLSANVLDYPKMDNFSELQGRFYNPSNEIGFNFGYSPNGVFKHIISLGGNYTKRYSVNSAWEIIDLNLLSSTNTLLGKKISSIQDVNLAHPEALILTNWVFTPLYGKASFHDYYISMTEVSAMVGLGLLKTGHLANTVINLGLKGQWSLTKNHNFRLDLKYIKTIPSKNYFESILLISSGWVYGF